jgi:hypothetical protein
MSDYYVRTPDQDESRGPFNLQKLLTLAEAGQINPNTLYYDEDEEEWIPIALNEDLKAKVFPVREKLSLKLGGGRDEDENYSEPEPDEGSGVDIADMLKAAEGETDETRHMRSSQKSFERAVAIGATTLGLMMLLAAVSFIVPHLSIIQGAVEENNFPAMLGYPFLLVGFFDLLMAILLLLSVTEIYPLIRGRGMLALGFGVYVGWALGDPLIMLAFGLGGGGLFLATIAQKFSIMLLAMVIGIGGNGVLAYLAISGRFAEFYSAIRFGLGDG